MQTPVESPTDEYGEKAKRKNDAESVTAPPASLSLFKMLSTLTISRVVLNMTRRFPYAFIPEISRYFGVPTTDIQNIVALQAGAGVTSPLFGSLSERFGRKRVLIAMLAMMSVAGFIGALVPQLWMFALMMVAFGIGKVIYDPALQAYIGDRVPYSRRGFAIGVTELGWSGALLVAAPLVGFILARSNLQAVLLVLAVLLGLTAALVWVMIPPDHHPKGAVLMKYVTPRQFISAFRKNPAALGGTLVAFLTAVANEVFFINYGVFMERSFDLQLEALGIITIAIAAAEIAGEFAVIGISDRLGKRRLALIGMAGAATMYLVIPATTTLPMAMFAVFLMFLGTEIGIVSSIPVYTEIMPKARAVMISAVMGAASLGRLAGAVLGGVLLVLTEGDFFVIGLVSLVTGLLGIVIFWLYVRENDSA